MKKLLFLIAALLCAPAVMSAMEVSKKERSCCCCLAFLNRPKEVKQVQSQTTKKPTVPTIRRSSKLATQFHAQAEAAQAYNQEVSGAGVSRENINSSGTAASVVTSAAAAGK